jgi:hypothetical protein
LSEFWILSVLRTRPRERTVAVKTWRLLVDDGIPPSEPLTAEEIAAELWKPDVPEGLWAEPCDPGDPASPEELPEVQEVLLRAPERIARAFLHHQDSFTPPWLFYWVAIHLPQEHPVASWKLTRVMIAVARDDRDLALIAAGPLENALTDRGQDVIGLVEADAIENPRVRRALSGVWPYSMDPAVWQRLIGARAGEPGIDD